MTIIPVAFCVIGIFFRKVGMLCVASQKHEANPYKNYPKSVISAQQSNDRFGIIFLCPFSVVENKILSLHHENKTESFAIP